MIEVSNVVKDYGTLRAVDHISFTVQEGEIVGFLGPNGAGKSTTLKMLTDYLTPTSGSININGKDMATDSLQIRQWIGYLPEHNPLYEDMTVYDYLRFVADIRNLSDKVFNTRLPQVIEECGIKEVINKKIGTLSKGYRQRVGLAQAILHDPMVIIMDEPTTGLDPNQILEIRDVIRRLGEKKTVILSSHIMQEVQAVCDRIIIINKGKIIADDRKEVLQSQLAGKTVLDLELLARDPHFYDFRMLDPTLSIFHEGKVKEDVWEVVLEYSNKTDLREKISRFITEKGWLVLSMQKQERSLEKIFHELTMESKTMAKAVDQTEYMPKSKPEDTATGGEETNE
ncbi:MAG: ATP-binding cassette domain-containing protein [Candidatus Cloacimonetes bacterium]|nr:ATP-binding cassette domain-containing protein [Candidatus Cloacimonadota bacterium]